MPRATAVTTSYIYLGHMAAEPIGVETHQLHERHLWKPNRGCSDLRDGPTQALVDYQNHTRAQHVLTNLDLIKVAHADQRLNISHTD